jgi:hypothetical protein
VSDSETSESFMRRIAPVLVVLGVGLYAYLSYIYQRFYTELDVTTSDVGFTYATTLARSMGLIMAALIAFIGVLVLRTLLGALLAFFEDPSAIIAIVPWR